MNISAKLQPPISSATDTIRHSGFGAGSSHGRVQAATMANLTVA